MKLIVKTRWSGLRMAILGLLAVSFAPGCVTLATAASTTDDPGVGEVEQGPDMKDPGPDFGFIPDAIGIVALGRFYVETSIGWDHDEGTRSSSLPLLLRVGIADDWEARLQTWVVQYEEDPTGDTRGSGPVQLGFKHRLSRGGDAPLRPAYGFEVELLLPVSTGGFDEGKVEPSVYFNADHTLLPGIVFTWNAGILYPVEETGDQFTQGFLAGAYSQFVTPDIQLYINGSVNYPGSANGGGAASVLGLGGYWYINRRVVLFGGYNAGLTDEAPDGVGVIGVSFAF